MAGRVDDHVRLAIHRFAGGEDAARPQFVAQGLVQVAPGPGVEVLVGERPQAPHRSVPLVGGFTGGRLDGWGDSGPWQVAYTPGHAQHHVSYLHEPSRTVYAGDVAGVRIGTTGRGIGPTYADKINRVGIRIQDLFDESILRQKVEAALVSKNNLLTKVYNRAAIKVDETVAELLSYAERVRPMVADTALELYDAIKADKTVLFEGGQATMLDVDHGTYPFVTSSNSTAGGASTGSGIGPAEFKTVIGIVKAYTTRVGSGPFPTELFDDSGEFLRATGHEYGTTTGRPRRCGWYDAPIARYSARINGVTDFVLTKLDVLTGIKEIPVCVAYDVDGKRFDEMPVNQTDFHHATPIYENFPGWTEDISSARTIADLPKNAQDYIVALEKISGARISAIGVGPARDAIIVRHDMLEKR